MKTIKSFKYQYALIGIITTGLFLNFISLPTDSIAQDNIDTGYYYRLTTQWQGDGKSLDVVNDGTNNKIQLAPTGNFTGQYWRFTSLGNGFYKMSTQFLGTGKSLDVVNDGKNNQLQIANTGNYSGQSWKITPVGNGFYRLTTQWQGDGKSLDVVNDGKNNRLQLAPTGDYSGQMWKLTRLVPIQKESPPPSLPKPVGSLSWVAFSGNIPSSAVNGGFENGRSLAVCRTNYNGALHPGKVVGSMCNIGWGGKEITGNSFEVLVNSGVTLQWVSVQGGMPANAVQGGTENGKILYVGQATMSNGTVHPGKVFRADDGTYICNYGYGGKEIVEKNNFKVLVQD